MIRSEVMVGHRAVCVVTFGAGEPEVMVVTNLTELTGPQREEAAYELALCYRSHRRPLTLSEAYTMLFGS